MLETGEMMTQDRKTRCCAIILAAGKGTRMKSNLVKVLHPLCGKPMLAYSIDVARTVGAEEIVVIIGYQGDMVREAFRSQGLVFVEQREQMGTGHAVLQARDVFRHYEGIILILCGDVPLLKISTLQDFLERHVAAGAVVTVLTTILKNPEGYGRVVKGGKDGGVLKIVEEKDATFDEKKIGEINTGIYCVESKFLFEAVAEIDNNNAQKEYYLTDMIEIATKRGFKVMSLIVSDSDEVMGINTPDGLEMASDIKQRNNDRK
jgi:UDP-N-acetylglucosamine diphosphorylase/glucosamine-1-phosphate N-acetyltransferase